MTAILGRMASHDDEFRMPPPSENKQLTAAQIDLVRRWIDAGAEWQPHWSFIAPRPAAVPPVSGRWPAVNPIDAFVQVRLAAEGLAPSPPADRASQIRRVYSARCSEVIFRSILSSRTTIEASEA